MWRPLMPGEPYKGMSIVIRPDLAQLPPELSLGIVDDMLQFTGRSDTIESCEPNSYICLKGNGFAWCEQWLMVEDLDEEPNIELDLEDVL